MFYWVLIISLIEFLIANPAGLHLATFLKKDHNTAKKEHKTTKKEHSKTKFLQSSLIFLEQQVYGTLLNTLSFCCN